MIPTSTTPADGVSTGRIMTFYSFKGGCGRTMAMANVAWILASNGFRVLAVDWDLESPGLHRYFHPFLSDGELRNSGGVIELLQEYAEATGAESAPDDWFTEAIRIDRFALPIHWRFENDGVLNLLPAGRQNDAYSAKVRTFDWINFWHRLNGQSFIDEVANVMRRDYDFTLIDSRTGLSDSASVCTVILPDTVVDCFALNTQSVEGAVAVARSIVRERRDLRVLPLPGRVEPGEHAKLQHGRDYAQHKFRPYLEKAPFEVEEYWRTIEVPYKPYYAYEETLAVFGDRPREPNSPLAAYMALTGYLTGMELKYPEPAERQRMSVVKSFERSAATLPVRILIRYAPVDRIWAEWMAQELGRAGHDCVLIGPQDPPPSLHDVHRVITPVSRTGLNPEQARSYWQRSVERNGHDYADFLVLARINGPRLPAQAEVSGMADLANLGFDDAVVELFNAVGIKPIEPAHARSGADRRLRYPAELAPHFRVAARKVRFTGRDDIVERMRGHLLDAGSDTGVVVLEGISGIGKSEIAREYVYRFAASYDIVWWIAADTYDEAFSGLEQLCEPLGVTAVGDEQVRIRAIKDALRQRPSNLRWLLVFDNAGDPNWYSELFPTGAGDIIVTTRNPDWHRKQTVLKVPVFTREESLALLAASGAQLSHGEASQLAQRFGDLPVALDIAGNLLATTASSLPAFLAQLDENTTRMLETDTLPGGPAVVAACRVALESLRQQSRAAAKVMELFSFLAPQPIPTAILETNWMRSLLADSEGGMRAQMFIGVLVRNMTRYALATTDTTNRSIVMHVLTQEIIRETLPKEMRVTSRSQAHEALAAVNPGDADDNANWPLYEALRPHVDASKAYESVSEPVRQLIVDLVRYLRLRGHYSAGQELAERALAAWSGPIADPDDELTLLLRFQLANAMFEFGDRRRAFEIDRDVVERLTRTRGDRHLYTLMVAGSLGRDLRDSGDWQGARVLEERTYAIIRDVLGEENPRTLMAANNYALSMRLAGEFARAAQLDLKTLNDRRRLLGRDNPFTLSSAHSYGADQRNLGDLQGSKNTLEENHRVCQKVLGAEHRMTLDTSRNLATTLRWLGDPRRALTVVEETARAFESFLGRSHPATLACEIERACAHSDLGDQETARRIAADVEKAFKAQYDADHPMCLVARNNLAVYIRRTGDAAAALDIAEETVARLAEVLGPAHPTTAIAQVNVANAAYQLRHTEHAMRVEAAAYKTLKIALEPEHPARIAITVNRLIGLLDSGRDETATLGETVAFAARVLGEEHPITRAGRERRRLNLEVEPFVM